MASVSSLAFQFPVPLWAQTSPVVIQGGTLIDGTKREGLPGLIDGHCQEWVGELYLVYGVTTCRRVPFRLGFQGELLTYVGPVSSWVIVCDFARRLVG